MLTLCSVLNSCGCSCGVSSFASPPVRPNAVYAQATDCALGRLCTKNSPLRFFLVVLGFDSLIRVMNAFCFVLLPGEAENSAEP